MQTKEEFHLPKARTTHKHAEGSKGFFASRGETEAVYILASQTKYTHFGNEHDATNLLNRLKSLDSIEDANAISTLDRHERIQSHGRSDGAFASQSQLVVLPDSYQQCV